MFQSPSPELLRAMAGSRPDDPAAPHRRELQALGRRERRAARADLVRRMALWLPGWLPGHVPGWGPLLGRRASQAAAPALPPPRPTLRLVTPGPAAPRDARGTPDGPRRAA